jgi:hypothetical protein
MFIVVLQVPNEVETVKIAAELHTHSKVTLHDDVLRFLIGKVKSFFEQGAPIRNIKRPDEWDITTSL